MDDKQNSTGDSPNEGEGNKTAAHQHNEAQRRFAQSGKVEEKAREAEKAIDGPEKEALQQAAAVAKRHSADPAVEKGAKTTPTLKLGLVLGGGAAVLAAAGLINHALARRAERRNPPEGKFVTVDGVRLHYIESGTGPAIVLLHGNGTMARDFVLSGVFDLLCKDHRVIAFDRPGFGFSDRPRGRIWTPDAQACLFQNSLQQLDVQRAVVVGHSWGTLVAVALALRDQPTVAGLVLLSGYYFPSVRADVALMSWRAMPLLGDILRYTISPLLGRLMAPAAHRKMFAPSPVTERFAKEFPVELEMRPSQIRASAGEAALMIPGAAGLAKHHSELSLPVAIMAGRGDKIVDCDSQAGRLGTELPGSTLTKVPGAGHMIHHIVPEQVAAVIRDLVRAATVVGEANTAADGKKLPIAPE
jgi:pimeloyl-ACP methyl ester carboxylesterase